MKNFISNLINAKQFVTWSDAGRQVTGRAFKPTDIKEVIAGFNAVMPGSDALIVDSECKYSYRAPVEKHYEFLKANGYTTLPEVKGQAEKKARDPRLFSSTPAKSASAETKAVSAEVAELKAQLAAMMEMMKAKVG